MLAYKAESADDYIQMEGENGGPSIEMSITYRPFLHEFLEDVKSKFELIIYSSIGDKQLREILNCIEKKKKYFSYSFGETFCLFANISSSVKCLDFLLSNRTPADIIVIESTAKALPLSTDNLIPVAMYEGSNEDIELVKLASLLDSLSTQKDVPATIKKYRESYKINGGAK